MKSKLRKQIALLFFVLIQVTAFAQPDHLIESRPDIFTFFTPNRPNNPSNANEVSKGIVFLDNRYNNKGSAFLIRTFRDDDKVCMCMTGHQLRRFYGETRPPAGQSIGILADLYMNYLGKDTLDDDEYTTDVTQFSKSFLSSATVLDFYDYDSQGADAALILVDKNQLPSEEYAMLGYSFDDDYWDRPEYWYTIGHPLSYPQRISDSLTYAGSWMGKPAMVELLHSKPYASAAGNSGSPVMIRLNTVAAPVKGIFARGRTGSRYSDTFRASRESGFEEDYRFSLRSGFTKINVLEQAIRQNCWKKSDSAAISTSQSYRQTVLVDNSTSTNPYNQNNSVSSAADLTITSALLFLAQLSSLSKTRMHANICNIQGFTLPTTYPGTNKDWQVTVSAKQINTGNDFNYTASGNSELELSTVVLFSNTAASSTARHVGDANLAAGDSIPDTRFSVYPNPSATGVFNILLPATGQYAVAIHSLDGKNIYQANCIANPLQVSLANRARGSYVLNVYDTQDDKKIVFTQLIIY